MKKLLFGGSIIAALVAVAFLAAVSSASHIDPSQLPWRPTCINDVNQPPPSPWKESFNTGKAVKFCQIDSTTMFFEQGVSQDITGLWAKSEYPDAYMNGRFTDNIFSIGHPSKFLRLEFKYYFPEHPTAGCFNTTSPGAMDQLVFIANNETDDFSSANFNAGRYKDPRGLNSQERGCGTWKQFNQSAGQFTNEAGKSFDANRKDAGAFSMEISNAYVEDIRFVTNNGTVTQFW